MISNLNSIASLISLYRVNVTYSQLLGIIRTQTSLGDHFSACGINFLKLITKIYLVSCYNTSMFASLHITFSSVLSLLSVPNFSVPNFSKVGCHFLLQGIFLTQGSNLRTDSLPLRCLGISLHNLKEANWKSTGRSNAAILRDLGLLSLILKVLRPPASKKSPLGSSFLPLMSRLAGAFQVEGEGAESELSMRATLP